MMRELAPSNPAKIESYPATLPIEIAMRIGTTKEICQAYGITSGEWERIRHDPLFLQDLEGYVADMQDRKKAFQLKARLQSDALLKTSWDIIHSRPDQTPAAVRADLIKATWRMAGLEPKEDKGPVFQNALQITLNLGD